MGQLRGGNRGIAESDRACESAGCSPYRGTPNTGGKARRYQCLEELDSMKDMPPNRRRFGMQVIAMSVALYLISQTAYTFLRQFVPLPSRQTLHTRTSATVRFDPELMKDLSRVKEIVQNYRDSNNETRDSIVGISAVDAIAFDRELVVSKTGLLTGTLTSEIIDTDTLKKIQEDFEELENLWRTKFSTIISDAFVNQFHPINPVFRPFIVHIRPSTQGKATNEEVFLRYCRIC